MTQKNYDDAIAEYLCAHRSALDSVATLLTKDISEAAAKILRALCVGRKVLICGNGGSAADAQHFAAELVGRFRRERRPLPALALTTDSSALTAIGNDYGFDEIFSRQVEALAVRGDVLIGISTSGNSVNVHKALVAARKIGCDTVGLLGRDGGSIVKDVDLALVVPAVATSHVQEAHIVIIHLLCELVESSIVASGE